MAGKFPLTLHFKGGRDLLFCVLGDPTDRDNGSDPPPNTYTISATGLVGLVGGCGGVGRSSGLPQHERRITCGSTEKRGCETKREAERQGKGLPTTMGRAYPTPLAEGRDHPITATKSQ